MRPGAACLLLGLSTLALAAFALWYGAMPVPVSAVWGGLAGASDPAAVIVRELRLPRTALALLLGGGLGVAGAGLQALLRNPLAEPGVLGISGGAALGAVLAFYAGLGLHTALALPLAGLGGAAAVTLFLYALAAREVGTVGLVLAGVALNSLTATGIALALSRASNPYAAYEIQFWLMGSVTDRSVTQLALVAPPMLVGIALLLGSARALDALALGEDVARSLGIDLARLRRRLVLGTALAVGPGVAVAGIIGFVGLIVPHVARALGARQPRASLPLSLMAGAAVTLAADVLARATLLWGELRLGVVTGMLGAPLFLLIALRMRPDRPWR
jgi:iron complex transport system permease protein